jgi:uncharacterized FlaG/YvyC family protein
MEDVMDITAVSRTTGVVAEVPDIPAVKAAEHRPIFQAVKALNKTEMFGQDNQLVFQREPESKRMVIQVINRNTREVVSQIPEEYLLRLAEDLK